ncbi:hypothetical protein [Burkholderia glumae]|uniref:hypothetical protein n=1 Tax=Burkholderia glumae TaxID=337 RepID=UPI001F33E3EA|nr:hypothetical protein [Burkholderia glumae]
MSELRISEPVTSKRLICATFLPSGPVAAVPGAAAGASAVLAVPTLDGAAACATVTAGPFATASATVAGPAAGWLCANAGAASVAANAISAQTICLTAVANTLCFILPLSLNK